MRKVPTLKHGRKLPGNFLVVEVGNKTADVVYPERGMAMREQTTLRPGSIRLRL